MHVPILPFETNLFELEIALKAAIEGGREIIKVYSKDFSLQLKSDDSPITDADLKSNKIIKEILSKTKYQILSEEDKDNKELLKQNKIWIIDPLDGTTDFVNRTGEFTVMIALVENKKPILGIILAASLILLVIQVNQKSAVSKSNPEKYSKKKRINLSKIKFEIDDPRCGVIGLSF